MDGAVAAAQVDAVAVVQQRGDLIEDIEWKGIQGRGGQEPAIVVGTPMLTRGYDN